MDIALSLASAGCRILANAMDTPEKIQRVVSAIYSAGAPEVIFNGDDLTERGCAEHLTRLANKQFGKLDILVNNAGIQHVQPIETFSEEHWDRIINLNLSAPFRLIKNSLLLMRQNNWGRIINIASVHGLVASTHKSAYVAAKHGLIGLTKTVALETANQPITCNAICPGFVQTALIQSQIEKHAAEKGVDIERAKQSFVSQKQPSMTFVSPKDIGAMVVFLCSDSCDQITGSSFPIDGGWTAQ